MAEAKVTNHHLEEVFGLRRQGYTLEYIGNQFGVTRERIRQICHLYQVYPDPNVLAERRKQKIEKTEQDCFLRLEQSSNIYDQNLLYFLKHAKNRGYDFKGTPSGYGVSWTLNGKILRIHKPKSLRSTSSRAYVRYFTVSLTKNYYHLIILVRDDKTIMYFFGPDAAVLNKNGGYRLRYISENVMKTAPGGRIIIWECSGVCSRFGKRVQYTDAEFLEIVRSCNSITDIAIRTETAVNSAANRIRRMIRVGTIPEDELLQIKKYLFKRGPLWYVSDFMKAWNAASSIGELSRTYDIPREKLERKAKKLRSWGYPTKIQSDETPKYWRKIKGI